jgi:MFS family permease
LKEYIAQLLRIVRDNRPFKLYLLTSIFLIMATMPMGFFTVYAIKHFGADEGMVGTFTLISIGGSIVGALVNGLLADRFGNKVALVSASFSMFVAILFALTSPSLPWFAIVFFGMGIFLGSELMIRYNFSIEYCHEDDRATYVGLMNTFLAPYYLCGFLGGVLSDMIGYKAMFGIGLLFSCIGIMMLIIKVHDPRKEY